MTERPILFSSYESLREQISGPDSWTSKPWVRVVVFRRFSAGDSSSFTTKESS